MSNMESMIKLAKRFEQKIKRYAQQIEQVQGDTGQLFFGKDSTSKIDTFQKLVHTAMDDKSNQLYNIGDALYQKTPPQKLTIKLDAYAAAKQGAHWIWDISPADPITSNKVKAAVNGLFQQVMGISMAAQEAKANAGAKAGGGADPIARNDAVQINIIQEG